MYVHSLDNNYSKTRCEKAHEVPEYSNSFDNRSNDIDEILRRDNKIRFKLQSQEEDFIFKPDERQFSFYQICQFPMDKKYMVRKIIYNEYGDMIDYREKNMKKDILDKFLKKCAKFKYTIYPAYNLDVVGFPEPNEILTAKSQILNEY
jgi:hypothetical protein